MMRFVFKILILALCSAGDAHSSSRLREELDILRQLSQDVDVSVPSRSPALPAQQAFVEQVEPVKSDEVSLSQAAPERKLSEEDRELMQIDLQSFEERKTQKARQKSKRPAGTPLYRGR